MENSLERLEQIMKPYFDKKEEIERLSKENLNEVKEIKNQIEELREKRKQEKTRLELRLERLRANKDREIEEYVASQPGFYAGYAATVKKDLEQAYKAQEDELIAEIKSFDATTEKQIENLKNSINSNSDRNYFIDMTDSKDLLNQISDANKEFNEIKNRPNYNKVYLREMIDIKNSLRKSLIAEQKEINFALQREKINFDSVMLELSNFKYQYNDQHQVTNGLEWKELYEKSNEISTRMNELRNSLKVVEEYLNLTELTKEEAAVAMSSLTPWEQAEYDRRNGVGNEVPVVENIIEQPELEQEFPEEENLDKLESIVEENSESEDDEEINEDEIDSVENEFEETNAEENSDSIENESEEEKDPIDSYFNTPEDLVDSYVPVTTDGKYTFVGTDTIFENMDDLCDVIYNDLLSEVDGMNSIKIDNSSNPQINYFSEKAQGREDYSYAGKIENQETVMLPNGEFHNYNDIEQALDRFYKKDKKDKFIVKEQIKEYKLSKSKIKELKQALKECAAVVLVRDEKLNGMDVKHVFVKEKQKSVDDIEQVGKVITSLPEGIYISRDEFKDKLKDMFKSNENKKLDWLRKLSSKVKSLKKSNKQEVNSNFEYEDSNEDLFEDLTEDENVKQR